MARDSPGEQAILQFLLGRGAVGDDFQFFLSDRAVIAALHQQPAGDRLDREASPSRIGQVARYQQAQILLFGEDFARSIGHRGRDDHFGEDLCNRFGSRAVKIGVDAHDSAEGRHAVACQRLFPRFEQRSALRHTAGVGMLDDHHCRIAPGKLGTQFERGVGIVVIVVAEFLALQLLSLRNTASMRPDRQVERRLLVRVLAIAQLDRRLAIDREEAGEQLLLVGETEPLADHRIVSGGGSESLGRAPLAEIERGCPVRYLKLAQQLGIIARIGHDGHELVVLRSRANHARPANIDILDDLGPLRPAHHCCLERIEIDHHEVDRADRMFFHRRGVLGIVAHRQQPAMDHRVQRLDPSVHHLRKAGEVGHVLYLQPRLAQRLGRAAGRYQLHSARGQRLPQFDQSALVGHRKQCPLNFHVAHGDITPFS